MPAESGFDFDDGGFALQPPFHDTATAPHLAPDDGQRGWSSALLPAKPQQFDGPSTNGSASDSDAADVSKFDARSARPPTAALHAEGLFVRRSAQRRP